MRTRPVLVVASCSFVSIGLCACATITPSRSGSAAVVAAATQQQQQELLGSVRRLAGTWEQQQEDGTWAPFSTTSVGSGGTAVREVMFPGSEHEMTNMYTMDGASVVLTHYCAMGNQPRMRCTGATRGKDGSMTLAFSNDGVGNLRASEEPYMGQMTLTIHNDNSATQEWWQMKDGKITDEHHMKFRLRRKG